MTDKLTDAEIKKALEEYINFADLEYTNHTSIEVDILKNALDLINRQEAEIKHLDIESDILRADVENLNRINDELNAENESFKAEVEKLQNAYKQCAWERDIFAEDMKEEIKKDCSYLMLDIKTIKAEAYKEFAELVHCHCESIINQEWNKKVSPVSWADAYKEFDEYIDNLLNELVGDDNFANIDKQN